MKRLVLWMAAAVLLSACSSTHYVRYQQASPTRFPVLHAVGYAVIDIQPGPSRSEKVLQAIRASKLDAYRELTEQVYGQQIQGATTLRDAVQTSNQLQASVEGMVRGARVVQSYPLDNMYATELELDTQVLYDLYRLEGAPDYVIGIINLRGNVVTVIDTRSRFGLPSAEISDNSRIVIIEADKQVIGILVDSVAEVVYLRSSEIDVAPSVGTEESSKFIQGVSNRDGELLILVDLNKLLSDDEWDELSQL